MPTNSFTGPSCKDLVEFMKSIKDIPARHKDSFESMSKKTIEAVCDIEALHVWESGDDIDSLLQLTQVIVELKTETGEPEGRWVKEPAMIIISSEQGKSISTNQSVDTDNHQRQVRIVETASSASARSSAT